MIDDVGRRSLVAGLLASGVGGLAYSANWPTRPVTWLVPFPPEGETDLFVRPMADEVARSLGQSVTIDNRGGFGGTLGANLVAIAPADGYMMLVGNTSLCYAPLIYPQGGFDLGRNFVPVSAFARVPSVLAINPIRLNVSDLKQFTAEAKKNPNAISIASSGVGTISHLAIGLFESRTDVKLKHVAYRGFGTALQELLAGNAAATFAPLSSVLGNV